MALAAFQITWNVKLNLKGNEYLSLNFNLSCPRFDAFLSFESKGKKVRNGINIYEHERLKFSNKHSLRFNLT